MLKALFGTAVVSDVTQLHDLFDKLKSNQPNVVHSIDNQITYIKELDADTSENAEIIANLSSVIKDNIIRSHDRFQQITKDLLWLNLTVYGQSELFTMIRQLIFSIIQLTERLDELTNAIQYVVMGSVPANLINPTTLYNILKNLLFHLPENYELIVGSRVENIHFYCKFVKVAAIANTHYNKIILNVPFKTAGRHFLLYKILPLRELLTILLFNIYLNFHILALITFSATTFCLLKQN